MRISDWSSDVCSSDLRGEAEAPHLAFAHRVEEELEVPQRPAERGEQAVQEQRGAPAIGVRRLARPADELTRGAVAHDQEAAPDRHGDEPAAHAQAHSRQPRPQRSEEHKSELQSLMRLSYA